MSLPPDLELFRVQVMAWVECPKGCLSPLGAVPVSDLQRTAQKQDGVLNVRPSIDAESSQMTLEEVRWARLAQLHIGSDSLFLQHLVLKHLAGAEVSNQSRSVTFASGEGCVAQCREHGLSIHEAEALMSGKPVTVHYQQTPFGPYADATVHDPEK